MQLIRWSFLFLMGFFGIEGKIYLVHIPKTGGTTVETVLAEHFQEDQVFLRATTSDFPQKLRPCHELITGHIPVWLYRSVDTDFDTSFKVVIFRDPVQRCLSHLRHLKQEWEPARNARTLDEVFAIAGAENLHNRHCVLLAGANGLSGQELVESAKQTLATFEHIMFFDHFMEDIEALLNKLQMTYELDRVPHLKKTEAMPVSEALLLRIQEINRLDMELYKYARTLSTQSSQELASYR